MTTTFWNDKKIKKDVYLLDENIASRMYKSDNDVFKVKTVKYNWYDRKNR